MTRKFTFRDKVRREQIRRKISTWQLSRESGVPRSTVQSFVNGNSDLPSRKLSRILTALNIGPDWLKRE